MILLSAVSRYEKSKQTIIIALFFFAQSPLPERLEQAIQAIPPTPQGENSWKQLAQKRTGALERDTRVYPPPSPSPYPCQEGIYNSRQSWILGSMLCILWTRFRNPCQWILDSGFQSLSRFRIPCAELRISKPRILDSASKNFPDFGIRTYLTWGEITIRSLIQQTRKNVSLVFPNGDSTVLLYKIN